MNRTAELIAEVKVRSPFGFQSLWSEMALLYMAIRLGDVVAVHTDEAWGGSYAWLKLCRAATTKPILAKGIYTDRSAVDVMFDAGADYVLTVGQNWEPENEFIWPEPLSFEQLRRWEGRLPKTLVWNSRDLLNHGYPKPGGDRIAQVRGLGDFTLVQASNIRSRADVSPHADAFIVGQHLPAFQ